MKQYKKQAFTALSLGLVLLLGTTSCQRTEDLVFDNSYGDSSLDRIEDTDRILRSAANGWETDYTTGSGDTFRLQFKFGDNKQVTTYSDFDPNPTVSSYTYNLSRSAVLSFDTYGLLHRLADPVVLPDIYDEGLKGKGYQGDFEFEILSATPEQVVLRGMKNRKDTTILKPLKHAPDANADVLNLQALNQSLFPEVSTLYKSIDVSGTPRADFAVEPTSSALLSATFYRNIATVKQLSATGEPVETRHELKPTATGFEVSPEISIDGKTYGEFVRNSDGDFVAKEAPEVKFNLMSNKPLVPNKHGEYLPKTHYISTPNGNHSTLFVRNILDNYRAKVNGNLAEIYVGYFTNTDAWRPLGFWNIGNIRNVIEVKPRLIEGNTWTYDGLWANDQTKRLIEQEGTGLHEFAVYFTTYFDRNNTIYIEDLSENGDSSYLRIVSAKDARYWYTVRR